MSAPATTWLKRQAASELNSSAIDTVQAELSAGVSRILSEVREEGEAAVRRWAAQFDDWAPNARLYWTADEIQAIADGLARPQLELLKRTAARIRNFARAQRDCLRELQVPMAGGSIGHELIPLDAVGCYAPGGRYPLPSSVLMTVIPARVAGVEQVWVASPRPSAITLAAAAVAGADGLLACGGAQALAAFANGLGPLPAVDFICGPGNKWVTEAKRQLHGRVGIDMLAGPSELLVLADDSACPAEIAADLLAQAEHDPDAKPILICLSDRLIEAVEAELTAQLSDLPTAQTAQLALRGQGVACWCDSLEVAVEVCNKLAAEHLELRLNDANLQAARTGIRHAGALFMGPAGAEVLGDYGAGPNHVLPTGASARVRGGLSVLDFIRVRSYLDLPTGAESARLAADAAELARLEGLEAHARAADRRC